MLDRGVVSFHGNAQTHVTRSTQSDHTVWPEASTIQPRLGAEWLLLISASGEILSGQPYDNDKDFKTVLYNSGYHHRSFEKGIVNLVPQYDRCFNNSGN